ncbi:MAG: tRNA (N6-threonylcarbamoyladenosine(37)-N6)-methyltransferase TrmO [Eubacterium sp.]|nr:tRNA (N6-threonylcarbamoyladenosine(37)-N6)-methyltransferase TrmO [Eubacterium sp.]
MQQFVCEPIAHIENEFTEKFGIPRQSGLVNEVVSRIVFEKEYRNSDALRGMEGFSHLWLIWVFSEQFVSQRGGSGAYDGGLSPETYEDLAGNDERKPTIHDWSPTVRPPRLGGNERVGVFATRSPNRPNPIGLSCVEIDHVESETQDGPVIYVRGADLMNGTPILDIKPYIAYADSHADAESGFASAPPELLHGVEGLENLPDDIDREAVVAILRQDPRPAYHDDPDRVYGLKWGSYDVRFTVQDGVVKVVAHD